MPNRILREGIIDSKAVNSLSDDGELFYRRLMSIVDDFGRFEADIELLRARLFARAYDRWGPSRVSHALADVSGVLTDDGHHLVTVYCQSSKFYLQINNFNQRVRAEKSKCPSPDGQMAVIWQADDCPPRASRARPRSESKSESESESESLYPATTSNSKSSPIRRARTPDPRPRETTALPETTPSPVALPDSTPLKSENKPAKQKHAMRQQYTAPISAPQKTASPNGNGKIIEKLGMTAPLIGTTFPSRIVREGITDRAAATYASLYPEADVSQVRDWIYQHCQAFGQTAAWPRPDNKICVGVLMAKGELLPLTAIYDWLFDLRKRRQFPLSNHAWFVTLASKYFVAGPLPSAPASAHTCSRCADTGITHDDLPWEESKHQHAQASRCDCEALPPVWWTDMYGDTEDRDV
jgi:hypothetical protein